MSYSEDSRKNIEYTLRVLSSKIKNLELLVGSHTFSISDSQLNQLKKVEKETDKLVEEFRK